LILSAGQSQAQELRREENFFNKEKEEEASVFFVVHVPHSNF
jgi:hypothetical protein